jgi:SAM-dependent methyltransferase
MYKVRVKIFQRVLRKIRLNLKEASVLDIGSGTGFYISLWNNSGAKNVEGADITEVAVDNLRKEFPANEFHRLDISSPGEAFIQSKSYDVVTIFDVLFHIVDDEKFQQALNNIHAILNQDGYFILSDNFIHRPTFRSKHHVSRNIKEFEIALENAGFKIIYRKPAFVFMNAPVDARGKFIPWVWRMQEKLIYRNKRFGGFLGAIFYPFELFLTRIKKEGPSTEVVICVKK